MGNSIVFVSRNEVFIPEKFGNVRVQYNGSEFSIIDSDGYQSDIQRADLSSDLRGITTDTLKKMLQVGKLHISKIENDYCIKFNVSGLGGGPIAAVITAIVGTVTTATATVVASVVAVPAGPAAVVAAAGATATACGAATAKLTAAAAASPLP